MKPTHEMTLEECQAELRQIETKKVHTAQDCLRTSFLVARISMLRPPPPIPDPFAYLPKHIVHAYTLRKYKAAYPPVTSVVPPLP